jgi:hypothetical protein
MATIFYHDPDGPGVEVTDNLRLDRAVVGLIAQPMKGRGWVELTPGEARQVAAALVVAADETERPRVPTGGRS